ncbi:MAG: hypothetical protein ABI387_01510 [Lacunisphaera sp.]
MQLSLPVIPPSTSAAPKPACAKNSSTPGTHPDSGDAAAESFDSYLPKHDRTNKPGKVADEKSESDTEQTAAILTAGFWMTMIQPAATTPEPTVSATAGSAAGSAGTALADDSTAGGEGLASMNPAALGAGVPSTTPTTGLPVVPNPTAAAATAADAAAAQMATPLPGNGPMSAKRDSSATAISTSKSTSTEAGSLSDSKLPTAVATGAITRAVQAVTALAVDAAGKLANSVQEKIAALTDGSPQSPGNQFSAAEKYFLNAVPNGVATVGAVLGTGVAKVNATMASATAPARPKSDSTNELTTSFVFSADPAPTATLTLDAPAPVATVRETMAAVITAVDALERRADVQQKSVDLQFNVGNEKLGLRVELRDGTVHTTFQTESPEMNSALAHEWHAVVQPALAREIHLADPVFHSASTPGNTVPATSSDSAANAFGHSAQQQREQPKAPPPFVSAPKNEFYESASPEAAPASASVSNSSQLLNALA